MRQLRRTAAAVERVEQRVLMSAGQLDTTFNATGVLQVPDPAAGGPVVYSAAAVQPDGRVVLATDTPGQSPVTVRRYTTAGAVDPTFGTNGVVQLTGGAAAFGTQSDGVQVLVEPDATILVAAGGGLARLTPTGMPDVTFGSAGTGYVPLPLPAALPTNGGGPVVAGAALQPDGAVVLSLNAQADGNGLDAYVTRYTAAGTLDTAYGSAGVTFLGFPSTSFTRVQAGGIALTPAGQVIASFGVSLTNSGAASVGGSQAFALRRLDPTGAVDANFGTTGGIAFSDVQSNLPANGSVVAVAPDGTIYQGQTLGQFTPNSVAALFAYAPLGGVYGAEPSALTTRGGGITGLAVQSDGKPVLAGYVLPHDATGTNIVAERFTPINAVGVTGAYDTAFAPGSTAVGGPGQFEYSINAQAATAAYARGDRAWSLALRPDGSAVLAGTTNDGTATSYDLLRLQPDATLAAGLGSISGTVYSDTNGNFTQQAGEPGLPNYQVYLDLNGNGRYDYGDTVVYSDADGNYNFGDLPPGNYIVHQDVLPPGQTHTNGVDSFIITLAAGGTVPPPGGQFGIGGASATPTPTPTHTPTPTPTPTATTNGLISGTVFLDNNADGTQQPLEPGLTTWGIYLDLNNNGVLDATDARTFTDPGGHFAFSGLAAGTYAVRENLPAGYVLTTAAFPRTVTIPANGTATVDVGYQYTAGTAATGGQITGVIFNDANRNGTQDHGETPLNGFGVYLDQNNNGTLDAGDIRVITGTDGAYQFLGLPAGTYRVRQNTPAGYTLTTPAFPRTVTVSVGRDYRVDIGNALNGTGYITGTVFQDVNRNATFDAGTDLGLNGFGVFIDANNNGTFDAGTDTRVFTNPAGQYTISGLAPGTYNIVEVPPAGFTLTTPAFPRVTAVFANMPVTVDIGYVLA